MSTEIWKPIPGFPGYDVSDMGRVRSLKRSKTRILRPSFGGSSGYPQIGLSNNGAVSRKFIHQLVILAFVSPRPEGMEVCHNDGNHQNNRLSNLRYDTHQANMKDKSIHRPLNGLKRLRSLLTLDKGNSPIVSWYDGKLTNIEEIINAKMAKTPSTGGR